MIRVLVAFANTIKCLGSISGWGNLRIRQQSNSPKSGLSGSISSASVGRSTSLTKSCHSTSVLFLGRKKSHIVLSFFMLMASLRVHSFISLRMSMVSLIACLNFFRPAFNFLSDSTTWSSFRNTKKSWSK